MLSCTSDRKPCCGPKIAPTVTPGDVHQRIDDVRVVGVDRRGIGDDADLAAFQAAGFEEPGRAEADGHGQII